MMERFKVMQQEYDRLLENVAAEEKHEWKAVREREMALIRELV